MNGWFEFATALAVFFAAHAVPLRPPVRRRLVQVFGERNFGIGYNVLSVGILLWLITAASQAPYIELWPFQPWQLWVPNLVMPLACLLLALSIGSPNALSFGGARNEDFDPAHPGAARIVRHPVLWFLALWSLSHAVPNGNLAHLVLFGLFAGFSFFGMVIIDRRKRRQMGEADWARMAHATSNWPLRALWSGRWRPRWSMPWPRLAGALALYLGLLLSHEAIVGVGPWLV